MGHLAMGACWRKAASLRQGCRWLCCSWMTAVVALNTFLFSKSVCAQLPLSIEALQVDRGEFTLDTGISFVSYSSWHLQPLVAPVEAREGVISVARPVPYSSHSVLSSLTARWGVAPAVEIYAGVRGAWTSPQIPAVPGTTRRASAAQIGASYSWKQGGYWPGLVMNMAWERALDEASQATTPTAGSWRLNSTFWYPLDPVVLSLELDYKPPVKLDELAGGVRLGGKLNLSPRVNFAVNHRVTLIGGVSLVLEDAAYRLDQQLTPSRRDARVLMGAGFKLSARSRVFVYGSFASGVENTGAISLNWRIRF